MENTITIEPNTQQKVFVVYLNLWNRGRGLAFRPEVQMHLYPERLSRFLPYTMDMSKLTKVAYRIAGKKYAFGVDNEDSLAEEFLARTHEVEYLHGRDSGARLLLGFAFENGKHFYIASDESALMDKIPFKEKPVYGAFLALAQNADKARIGFNIQLRMSAWNQIKFDYRERQIKVAE